MRKARTPDMRISYSKLIEALMEIDDRLVPDPNSSGQSVVYAVEDAALGLLSVAAREHLRRKEHERLHG